MKKTDNQEVKNTQPTVATPAKATPATPVKANPAPAKATVATPVKAVPATPAKATVAQPAQARPVQAVPAQARPVQAVPAQAVPAKPVQVAPAQAVPTPSVQPKVEEKKVQAPILEEPKPVLQETQELQELPAANVSNRTKRDHRKTSVVYTAMAIVLMILAIVPIIVMPAVLAMESYELVPYYSFWPFVGVILAGAFGLIYMVVALCVTRKKSKHDVKSQTARIATAFICLTCVFALLITYILPDVIGYLTQNTLFVEDMTYNASAQAHENAQLERDFIMYNVVNGNLNNYDENGKLTVGENGEVNGDFSYATLSKRVESNGVLNRYVNSDIQARYQEYLNKYGVYNNRGVLEQEASKINITNAIEGYEDLNKKWIKGMKDTNPTKYDLYNYLYTNYVLLDFDYALYNKVERRAFTLAIVDYIYENSTFTSLLKEGWNNPRLKALFNNNFDNFKQDGYNTLDDPLLLYAQLPGRLTTSVIIKLILNGGYSYSQPVIDGNGNLMYTDDGNCLYQIYDMDAVNEFVANGGTFPYEGELDDYNGDGVLDKVKYGYNDKGWMLFENGVTKRPLNWLVLDMQGTPMDIASIDLSGLSVANIPIGTLIPTLLESLPTLVDSLGNFIGEELIEDVVVEATGGAKLKIGIFFDDNGDLAINLYPMNPQYGMLGFAQASWVESGNLLFAVINVIGLRNWFVIFGAVGVTLIIAAGVLRECGQKTRERTEISRFRMKRANVERDKKAYDEQQAKLEEERKAKEKEQRIAQMRTRKY